MKKALFIPVIIALLFVACKREHSASVAPSGKKYKVTLNVLNFTQKKGTFSNGLKVNALSSDTLTNLSDYLDVLYYVVYNNLNHAVNPVVIQDSTMADMGTITDSLPAGNYQIRVIAGKKGLVLTGVYQFQSEGVFGYGGYNWQDTFWGGFNVTVGTTDVTQDLTLNRVVGKVQLHVLDNIPANADSLIMQITPETNSMRFDLGYNSPGGANGLARIAIKIPASAKGHPNFIMDKILGNIVDPCSVSITCKDASNTVIAHAVVDNVSNAPNVKSVLSGNLFSNPPGSSPQTFQVKADTAWSSTPLHQGF